MDKQQANECFRHVVKELKHRGIIVRGHSSHLAKGQYNMTNFSKLLGTHSGVIPAILTGKPSRNITDQMINQLCDRFGVNQRYMRMAEGPMFADQETEAPHQSSDETGNILLSSVIANAGDTVEAAVWEEKQFFGIPGLEGELTAFNIQGNSMEPILKSGDLVFCKHVNSLTSIRRNEIYAVCAEGSVRIKYIERLYNGQGEETSLKLISENAEEHPPIHLDLDQPIRIYKVCHFLTDLDQRLSR